MEIFQPTSDNDSAYVPYTGATSNVNLGIYSLTATGITNSSMTLGSVLFAGTAGIMSQDNAKFFWDDTTKRLGLGTNSPEANLHVEGSAFPVFKAVRTTSATSTFNSGATMMTKTSGDMANGFGGGFIFGGQDNAASGNWGIIGAVRDGADGSGALVMYSYASGSASERMRISSAGNVGIGTTAPTGLLQVHGSANEVIVDSTGRLGIGFANASAMNASAAYKLQVNGAFTFGDGTNILGRSTYTAVGGNPAFASESGKGFTFYVDNANVRAIDISSAGNVGIGTTGPISPLTVQTNSIGVITASFINTQAGAYTSGTGGAGMVGYSDNGAATTNDTRLGWLGFGGAINSSHTLARPILIAAVATENWSGSANGADLTFATTQNGTTGRVERMRITGSGNVIVGATTGNANAILDVQSTTKAFMPPRMTTTQKNAISSPTAGMVVYDSTLNKLCVYGAASWETVTSV